MSKASADMLVCPACHGRLNEQGGSISCESCKLSFEKNQDGFLEFALDRECYVTTSTTSDHADAQDSEGAHRLDDEYILPYVRREASHRVLDVGCGIGRTVKHLVETGYDAYGVDLPCLSGFWARDENDPNRFFCCAAARLPFPDGYFDTVISLGVIEHIGTIDGECTLGKDYQEARRLFALELLRVTRLGGRILIACPNKHFPIDPQHLPGDEHSPDNAFFRLRGKIYARSGMNIHRTWGKYHLLSFQEVEKLFIEEGQAFSIESLPIKGYFGLTIFQSGALRPFARIADVWINDMPAVLRSTFLNPYVMVQVRK